eukprot:GHVN01048921.1.p1 GENE.GHVN01048921.1~~GHVN01048921.1.p1  ORF type:complete len:158 (+),score=8.04 GHVN01048921.1:119-592(+)
MLNTPKVYVRPQLDYCASIWCPWLKKDIAVLEKVQKRAVRGVRGLQGRTYIEKVEELGLTTLEARRTRGDIIECYKLANGLYNACHEILTMTGSVHGYGTRQAQSRGLQRPHQRKMVRSNFFTCRAPRLWNAVPEDVKAADCVNVLKSRYDKWIDRK